jgi:lysozyme
MELTEQLIRDEGIRLHPYRDTVGKLTIGIGRNLDDIGITREEAIMLLQNDIATAKDQLLLQLPWVMELDDARRDALINMTFNLGIGHLLGFKKFLAALRAGDYQVASQEMLDSTWAQQVGPRAHRLAVQIETGVAQ